MDLRTSERDNLPSNLKLCGLILLRADADALGLDISVCLAMEKTNPARAYIEFKLMVGKRISATSNIYELRALNKLWDNICATQSNRVQEKKWSSLSYFRSQKHPDSNQCRTIH